MLVLYNLINAINVKIKMSEKQTKIREASPEDIKNLYAQCANLLVTSPDKIIKPSYTDGMLVVSVPLETTDGKWLNLSWLRPANPQDPTTEWDDIPVQFSDPEGELSWQTPIDIKVYDQATGSQLNDYIIENAGYESDGTCYEARAEDGFRCGWSAVESGLDNGEMTTREVNGLLAQIDAVLTGQFQE